MSDNRRMSDARKAELRAQAKLMVFDYPEFSAMLDEALDALDAAEAVPRDAVFRATYGLSAKARGSFLRFAADMCGKLRANAHKGDAWASDDAFDLLDRVVEETRELKDELKKLATGYGTQELITHARARIRREAADVANMAMMVADSADENAPSLAGGIATERAAQWASESIADELAALRARAEAAEARAEAAEQECEAARASEMHHKDAAEDAEARAREAKGQRDAWAHQCNLASEAQADLAGIVGTLIVAASLLPGETMTMTREHAAIDALRALLGRAEKAEAEAAKGAAALELLTEYGWADVVDGRAGLLADAGPSLESINYAAWAKEIREKADSVLRDRRAAEARAAEWASDTSLLRAWGEAIRAWQSDSPFGRLVENRNVAFGKVQARALALAKEGGHG